MCVYPPTLFDAGFAPLEKRYLIVFLGSVLTAANKKERQKASLFYWLRIIYGCATLITIKNPSDSAKAGHTSRVIHRYDKLL